MADALDESRFRRAPYLETLRRNIIRTNMEIPKKSCTAQVPPALSYWVIPQRFLAGSHPYGAGDPKRLLELLNVGIDTIISLQPVGEKSLHGIKEYSRMLHSVAATLNRRVRFLRQAIADGSPLEIYLEKGAMK
jgi:hypothetical protein